MMEKKSDPEKNLETGAREKLEQCRHTIAKEKPTSTSIDYVDRVLNPSDPKDWQIIRHFGRVSQSVFIVGGNS